MTLFDASPETTREVLLDFDNYTEWLDQVTQARDGTLMYVHPKRWIREDEDPLDFQFVTGIGLVDKPLPEVKELTTHFRRFSEFIDQVSEVEARSIPDGYEATWHLDLGVSLLRLKFSYSLEYHWSGANSLPFHQVEGGRRYVYGAPEWAALEDDRTLFFYTTATPLGRKDSTPVPFAKLLPHL